MCFNKEVSIISYFFGLFLSGLLFYKGDPTDKTVAIFCITFLQIQLLEYFLWSDQECKGINNLASQLIYIALILQPISLLLSASFYNTTELRKETVYIILGIIVIASLPVLYKFVNSMMGDTEYLCSKGEEGKSLVWDTYNFIPEMIYPIYILYFCVFIFFPLSFRDKEKGYLLFFMIMGSLLFSLVYFWSPISKIFYQWKSMWCFVAILTPLIFLIKSFL